VDVELLYFDGCAHHEPLEQRLSELLGSRSNAELRLRLVESDDDARRVRFLGSPSVRIDGSDVEPGANARTDWRQVQALSRRHHPMHGSSMRSPGGA
jgi:hypothetical protein